VKINGVNLKQDRAAFRRLVLLHQVIKSSDIFLVHAIKAYVGVEFSHHSLLDSVLDTNGGPR